MLRAIFLCLFVCCACGRHGFDTLDGGSAAASDGGGGVDAAGVDAAGVDAGGVDAGGVDAGAEPPDDLLLWWRFEDDPTDGVVDSSRYGRDGACVTGCPVLDVGRIGSSFRFSSGGYLSVTDPGLDVDQPFTISCWVAPDALDGNDTAMAKVWGDGDLNSWKLWFRSGTLNFETSTGSRGEVSRDVGTLTLGEWIHLAGVWDGARKTLFVDGVSVVSADEPRSDFDGHPVFVGADENTGVPAPSTFDGRIDDVRVYGRALTAPEIAALATP